MNSDQGTARVMLRYTKDPEPHRVNWARRVPRLVAGQCFRPSGLLGRWMSRASSPTVSPAS